MALVFVTNGEGTEILFMTMRDTNIKRVLFISRDPTLQELVMTDPIMYGYEVVTEVRHFFEIEHPVINPFIYPMGPFYEKSFEDFMANGTNPPENNDEGRQG